MKKDADVPNILKMDGIASVMTEFDMLTVTSIPNILKAHIHHYSWAQTIINSDSNSATLICQPKGAGNRMHHHPDWNEWWYILEGSWMVKFGDGDGEKRQVFAGDIVFIEKGRSHMITALTYKAIRLAVSRYDVDHVYRDDDYDSI